MAMTLEAARKKHEVNRIDGFRKSLVIARKGWMSGRMDKPGFLPRPPREAKATEPFPYKKMPLMEGASPSASWGKDAGPISPEGWNHYRQTMSEEAQRDMDAMGPVYDASHPDSKMYIQLMRVLFPRLQRGNEPLEQYDDNRYDGIDLLIGKLDRHIEKKLEAIEDDGELGAGVRERLYDEVVGHANHISRLINDVIGEDMGLWLDYRVGRDDV